jgi:hypothetical protein
MESANRLASVLASVFLNPLVLSHTFTDPADGAEGIFLRLYLIDHEEDLPSTVHVGAVDWTSDQR